MKEFTKARVFPYAVTAFAALILILARNIVPISWIDPIIRVLIYLLFGMSTNILIGYVGMIPMGQAVFVGIVSYSFTIMMAKYGIGILPALLLSLMLSVLLSVFIGFFCLKGGEGFAVGFIYMGFNTLFNLIVTKVKYFGLEAGMSGAKRFAGLSENSDYLVFVTIVVAISFMIIYLILHSPMATVFKGIRENPERVTYFGVNIFNMRLIAFCISAFFTSVAGLLYSMYLRGAYPNMSSNGFSLQMLMMCVIGGMYYFTGPIFGSIFICLLFSRLPNLTIYWQSIFGVLLITVCLGMQGGILGFFDEKIRKPIQRKRLENKRC